MKIKSSKVAVSQSYEFNLSAHCCAVCFSLHAPADALTSANKHFLQRAIYGRTMKVPIAFALITIWCDKRTRETHERRQIFATLLTWRHLPLRLEIEFDYFALLPHQQHSRDDETAFPLHNSRRFSCTINRSRFPLSQVSNHTVAA